MAKEPACRVCASARKEEIEKLLMSGFSITEVAVQIGDPEISPSIERHYRAHMTEQRHKVASVVKAESDSLAAIAPIDGDVVDHASVLIAESLTRVAALARETGSLKAEETLFKAVDLMLRLDNIRRQREAQKERQARQITTK